YSMLYLHKTQMSATTQKMHMRFVHQLCMQASVPFLVLVCPLFSLILLVLFEVPLKNNLPGYLLLAMLMVHGPLTSFSTIALYDPYRK
ncbi:hypothetical protein PFISCL1PPCAC_13588, partial [Pristionchus fissidentatus]